MAKQVRAVRAKTTIALAGGRFIHQGDLVRSDDPVVKSDPGLFELVDDLLGIEQATKNPGQRRAAKKPDPAKQDETPEADLPEEA